MPTEVRDLKTLRLLMLGRFRMYADSQAVSGLECRKAQELLCYLLLHRDRPQSREHLAGVLWNNESETRARSYLRKTLWQLQTALGHMLQGTTDGSPVESDGDYIYVTTSEHCWVDTDAFQRAYYAVKSVSGGALDESQAQALEDAERLYEGELLDGWGQDWCLCERERLHYMYLAIMDKLLDYSESRQSYERGIDYAMRILQFDRVHERTYQKLMRLHCLAGDRTSALREYEQCATVLLDELGVEPSRQTKTLYQQVVNGQLEPVAIQMPVSIRDTGANADLARVLDRLRDLSSTLLDLQGQVQTEIDALEELVQPPRT